MRLESWERQWAGFFFPNRYVVNPAFLSIYEVKLMCVLCGEFVMNIHWTDSRQGNPSDSLVVAGNETQRIRQRERTERVCLANRLLQFSGLKLEDWSGSKYVLRDRKGNALIIQDVGGLWPAVEKMLKRKLDPLDPEFLKPFDKAAKNPEG